eukprot:Clim_evm11s227 gene=Clim_evmTU11s227
MLRTAAQKSIVQVAAFRGIGRPTGVLLGNSSRHYGSASSELLLNALKLEEVDTDIYVAKEKDLWKPAMGAAVFGGQVIGQAIRAAHFTIDASMRDGVKRSCHSLHAYFLRGGDHTRPIVYQVRYLREGRTFHTTQVDARQNGNIICSVQVSFSPQEEGFMDYQPEMPSVPGPEDVPSTMEKIDRMITSDRVPKFLKTVAEAYKSAPFPLDVKHVDPVNFLEPPDPATVSPKTYFWMKAGEGVGSLGDDEDLHRCIAVYSSDWAIGITPLRKSWYQWPTSKVMVASLDHAMWFYRPFRMDDWILFEMEAQSACANRGVSISRMYTRDGHLAAVNSQEALMRLRKPPSKKQE